jgi:hypothetical protein
MELAEKRNAIPLPPIPNEYSVRLPPVELQLSTDNIPVFQPRQNVHNDGNGTSSHSTEALNLMAANQYVPTAHGNRNMKVASSPILINIPASAVRP